MLSKYAVSGRREKSKVLYGGSYEQGKGREEVLLLNTTTDSTSVQDHQHEDSPLDFRYLLLNTFSVAICFSWTLG
jgi:hypothetical protein